MQANEAKELLITLGCMCSHTDFYDDKTAEALKMAIKNFELLQIISDLFTKWKNGEVNDNEYFFQMQNILLFGKTLEGEVSE